MSETKALVVYDSEAKAYRRYVQWHVLPPQMKEKMGLPTQLIGIAREIFDDVDQITPQAARARLKRFRERDEFPEDCRQEAENILGQWEGTLMVQGLSMALQGERESYPYWRDLMEMKGHIDNTKRVEVNHTVEVRAVQRMSERELSRRVIEELKSSPEMEGKSEEEIEKTKEMIALSARIGAVAPVEAQQTDEKVDTDANQWRRSSDEFNDPTV